MKTYVRCEMAENGTCKEVDCVHYWEHSPYTVDDNTGNIVYCTGPEHCNTMDLMAACILVSEN